MNFNFYKLFNPDLKKLNNYSVLTSFDSYCAPKTYWVDEKTNLYWKGFILEKNKN